MRDYRTDLTIRTCPVCFRDIKASSHTSGLMADHGFTIRPGYRMGHCPGTGMLPWEKSCDPAKTEIQNLLAYAAKVAAHLAFLNSGDVTELTVRGDYNWKTREYGSKVLTPADKREWEQALKTAIWKTQAELKNLWDGSFGSIPWYRMAVRTWKPVADNHVAVGAPLGQPVGKDFAGSPLI